MGKKSTRTELNNKQLIQIDWGDNAFSIDQPRVHPRENRITQHYFFANYSSFIIIIIFLGLLVIGRDIPNYLVGIVGTIVGYYLSKKPFES